MYGIRYVVFTTVIVAMCFAPLSVSPPATADGHSQVAPFCSFDEASAGSNSPSPKLNISVTTQPNSEPETNGLGTATYTVKYNVPDDASKFTTIVESDTQVSDTDGFTKIGTDKFRATSPSPSLTFSVHVNDLRSEKDYQRFYVQDEWALIPTPNIKYQWASANSGSWECSRLKADTDLHNLNSNTKTVSWSQTAVFVGHGPHNKYHSSVDGVEMNLVVPTHPGSQYVSADKIMDDLILAEEGINIDSDTSMITTFALPPNSRAGGVAFSPSSNETRHTTWVNAYSLPHSSESIWVHEYSHAKHDYYVYGDMFWFIEASSEYTSELLPYQRYSHIDTEDFMQSIETDDVDYSSVVLTDRETWTKNAQYERGSAVLYRLDVKIRLASDNEETVMDMIQWMNKQDDPVSYSEFKGEVVHRTNQSVGIWLDTHVDGSQAVSLTYNPVIDTDPISLLKSNMSAGEVSETQYGEERYSEKVTKSAAVNDYRCEGRRTHRLEKQSLSIGVGEKIDGFFWVEYCDA